MRLSGPRFSSLLCEMGQTVAWSPAVLCPCRDPLSGAASLDCFVCSALGTFWKSAASAVCGVSGQKVRRVWEHMGEYQTGDVVVSIPANSPMFAAGEYDRVLFVDSSIPWQGNFVNDGTDIIAVSLLEVDEVYWKNPDGSLASGAIPTIACSGPLQWVNGGGPPAGVQYTAVGRRLPEYFVFGEFPSDRAHYHGTAGLPRRVVLRLFDLFGR